MSPDGIDQPSPLADQKIARPEHESRGLLLFGLHSHEAHRRTLRRLADRLSIDRVVLVPLHERLDVGRRDQPHLMAQCHQFARPVVRAPAGLQRHRAARLGGEEVQQLRPAQLPAEYAPPARVRTVGMEHVLRDSQTDRGNLRHGRLPQVVLNTATLAR